MKLTCFSILCLFILAGCSDKKVEITAEYIINENWSKKNEEAWANSITINKMKVKKDSTLDPFSDLSQEELLSKLEEDSSFMHYTNVKIKQEETYKGKKVFFNRYNGFSWGSKSRHNSADTVKTIGNLQPASWYKFSDLGLFSYTSIYVYIDSAKKVHRFNINVSNY